MSGMLTIGVAGVPLAACPPVLLPRRPALAGKPPVAPQLSGAPAVIERLRLD